jgi:transposase
MSSKGGFMREERLGSGALRIKDPRREAMLEPEEVSAMLRLNELGWGAKRIAQELGISRNTVKDYIAAGGWTPYRQPGRKKALDGLEEWLRERLRRHRGNADVIRQELAAEKGIIVSLRTVERTVKPYRQELEAEARATVRFETAGPANADRFWRAPGRDRRRESTRVFVCCHPRLFAPPSHQGVSKRAARELV